MQDSTYFLTTRWDLCKLRRKALNMSQVEFAKHCGVSVGVIQKMESTGPYNPRHRPRKTTEILGVTFDFIYYHVEWPFEKEDL